MHTQVSGKFSYKTIYSLVSHCLDSFSHIFIKRIQEKKKNTLLANSFAYNNNNFVHICDIACTHYRLCINQFFRKQKLIFPVVLYILSQSSCLLPFCYLLSAVNCSHRWTNIIFSFTWKTFHRLLHILNMNISHMCAVHSFQLSQWIKLYRKQSTKGRVKKRCSTLYKSFQMTRERGGHLHCTEIMWKNSMSYMHFSALILIFPKKTIKILIA